MVELMKSFTNPVFAVIQYHIATCPSGVKKKTKRKRKKERKKERKRERERERERKVMNSKQ